MNNTYQLINQDCISWMNSQPEKSIQCCVTSPPYNLNIAYGTYKDSKPRDEYLSWLEEVFKSVSRCLKNDGHFWLNVGYSNIDPWVGMDVANIARKHFVLQNNFTWVKSIYVDGKTYGHFKPINSDRFSNPTWEHLFHFTKSGRVVCDKLTIGVPYEHPSNLDNTSRARGRLIKKMGYTNKRDFDLQASEEQKILLESELSVKMKERGKKPSVHCRGNSWYIPYDTIASRSKERGSHPATFPVKLVEMCIKFSGINEGSVVYDPFVGTGTTILAGLKLNMNCVGTDLDSDYLSFAKNRIDYFLNNYTRKSENIDINIVNDEKKHNNDFD